ncbi:hypothetical protein [Streptomyces sp. CBMA123]|uniref:hypothetical protein n=1 Tax=Streptomyces sp. CBMA123 TaxID=1896313 RepID=UPI001661FFAA|nr:hypothetical protein [Streptomyces sp. CBMA123]MBD0692928.1 hypothetical protein [Streptomyces sp. CBMA123]
MAAGAAIGILAGLCAWPRGAGQDLRRRTAALLDDSAEAVRETVALVTGTGPATRALGRALHSALLTEALYAQYRCERHDPAENGPNWQAAVLVGQHTVRGAEPLLARIPPGTATPHGALLRQTDDVAAAFRREAAALRAHEPAGAARPALDRAHGGPVGGLSGLSGLDELGGISGISGLGGPEVPEAAQVSPYAVDVTVWLAGLLDDLRQIHDGRPSPAA